jgi:hypothetical protein
LQPPAANPVTIFFARAPYLDDLQCEKTAGNSHGHDEDAGSLEAGGSIGRVIAGAVVGVTAGVSVGLVLDVVGLGLAEDVTLDDLGVVELVEVVAGELARGLGVERTLDILKSGEGSPVAALVLTLNF